MRAAIKAVDDFGAIPLACQAREDLLTRLTTHDRAADAADLREELRAVYTRIGANGWSARLDAASVPAPESVAGG